MEGRFDDARSSNQNKIESKNQRRMKRKINEDDLITKYRKKAANVCKCSIYESNPFDYINIDEKFEGFDVVEEGLNSDILPLKVMYPERESIPFNYINIDEKFEGFDVVEEGLNSDFLPLKVMYSERESNPFDYINIDEKFEGFDVLEEGSNSHLLPLKVMYSERAIQRDLVSSVVKKTEGFFVEPRPQFRLLGRVNNITGGLSMCLDQPYLIFQGLELRDLEDLREDIKLYLDLDSAKPTRIRFWEALLVVCDWELVEARKKQALGPELLGEERGLDSEAHVKNLLQGKTYSELEELQSEIELQMRSGSPNIVEFWEPILKHIYVYKAKAFLKQERRAKIFRVNLVKDQNDQTETKGAEGTGSSSSPELLCGEEIADNFEMNMMGVMEEGDATSTNIDQVILRSPVYRPVNKCRSKKPKYFNGVHNEGEGNNYIQTH